MSNNRLNCCCGQGRICPTHGDTTPEERINMNTNQPNNIPDNCCCSPNFKGFCPTHGSQNNETPQEKARRIGVPVIPKLPESQPSIEPNPVVAICGECNREVRQIEGYCCGNPRCPLQSHITC